MEHKYTNALINETSPYLLQHAHNPVNWEAWNPLVLERAKNENKPLLISIGYAACHWCHVMEKECFEDETVAKIMNNNYVTIKIDREERPDVDQIYMDALQLMTGNGGWPLNIVALPDGRPFWGATYVPKEKWNEALHALSELFTKDSKKVKDYATKLNQGIKEINLVKAKTSEVSFTNDELDVTVGKWSTFFDTFLGGYKRAPKFMMPNHLDFLLHYATSKKNKSILEYVNTTLTRMAYGGVFDPIDGGFSRYSVDTKWHVPHFEKMLYDNGQLTSLYSKAYAVTKNPLYKETVEKTIAFINNELMDKNGGFYSSLDADSYNDKGELEEGAFYVWTEDELSSALGNELRLFKDYYNINSYGLWEEDKYVLIRDNNISEITSKYSLSTQEINEQINDALKKLKKARDGRDKPRLDDKILTSWNGLMLKGLTDAYRYLGNDDYLKLALKNADFISGKMLKDDGALFRNYKNGKSSINGFLDDYATIIDAFIGLYEVTFEEKWLFQAKKITDFTIINFRDDISSMFFYTSKLDDELIRRTIEVNDNVISSSNSIMANNLLKLHKVFHTEGYGAMSDKMLNNVQDNFVQNAQNYANWLHLILYRNNNFYEIAIVGKNYKAMGKKLAKTYIPNSILLGTEKDTSKLGLLQNRFVKEKSLIYLCIEGSCRLPVTDTKAVLKQL
ncbi:thioredoxin domain-containing protein [Maribacter sp. CXY002]|uniref:thioredoxin domain-containing protein n=1 Tax=Maribacter luteocoastalis TaxID=3407671 RepID=UPI003B6700DC